MKKILEKKNVDYKLFRINMSKIGIIVGTSLY